MASLAHVAAPRTLFSSIAQMAPHERERYDAWAERYSTNYAPISAEEHALVAEAALASYRADRCRLLETLYFEQRVKELRKEENLPETLSPHDTDLLHARVFLMEPRGLELHSRLFKQEMAFNRIAEKKLKSLAALIQTRRLAESAEKLAEIDRFLLEKTNPIPAPHDTPRNALCPCGSGLKYKRCCGRAALPALTPASAAA